MPLLSYIEADDKLRLPIILVSLIINDLSILILLLTFKLCNTVELYDSK